MAVVGLACGVVNGLLVTRLRLSPFIVTLAMLFIARGLGLWITETRAINLPESFLQLAAARLAVDPVARLDPRRHGRGGAIHVELHAFRPAVVRCGTRPGGGSESGHRGGPDPIDGVHHLRDGRGCGWHDRAGATGRCLAQYGTGPRAGCDCCGSVGGASLFGGRGTAVGAVLGALLIETVRNGLNLVDADPYIYPLITGAIIFIAVLLDSVAHQQMVKLTRRKIRPLVANLSREQGN